MILDFLRDLFIGVLYLCGIGFFGFFASLLFVMLADIWRKNG